MVCLYLEIAQLVAELLLQLVDDLRDADVRQDGVVLGAEHDGVGLDRVQTNEVLASGQGRTEKEDPPGLTRIQLLVKLESFSC